MTVEVKVGEGSGFVLIFFLWLAVGLELINVSEVLSGVYFIISFVMFFVYLFVDLRRAIRAAVARRVIAVPREKRYSLGWLSLIVLKGSVKTTRWRATIFVAILCAWLGALVLVWVIGPPLETGTTMNILVVSMFLLLTVTNFLEVRWKTADARQ